MKCPGIIFPFSSLRRYKSWPGSWKDRWHFYPLSSLHFNMITMSARVVLLLLIIAHVLFWAIVVVRILVSRKRILYSQKTGQPGAGQPVRRAEGLSEEKERSGSTGKRRQGLILLWALAACLIAYYLLLLLWASEPGLAGVLLLPESTVVGAIGIVLIIAGLVLITWAYLRLHSFKLIAT